MYETDISPFVTVCLFFVVLRQHLTKTALRLSTTALHKFPKPFSVRLWLRFLGRHLICLHIFRHLAQNPSTYVSMPSEFLYNLTKNLTAHLRHYLCAVLP